MSLTELATFYQGFALRGRRFTGCDPSPQVTVYPASHTTTISSRESSPSALCYSLPAVIELPSELVVIICDEKSGLFDGTGHVAQVVEAGDVTGACTIVCTHRRIPYLVELTLLNHLCHLYFVILLLVPREHAFMFGVRDQFFSAFHHFPFHILSDHFRVNMRNAGLQTCNDLRVYILQDLNQFRPHSCLRFCAILTFKKRRQFFHLSVTHVLAM